MQYKIPQNVQIEDKIVGPLTLKQLGILGFGGATAYLPFQGVELSLVAIILLSVSLHVLVKGRVEQARCAVPSLKYQEQYVPVSE